MLSRLRSLRGRENGDRPESREMQKSKTRSNDWLWHRNSGSWAGDAELPGGDAAMKPKSHPMLLTKNQMKQEVDRLTTELQLIISQRNELQDHMTFISEDTMDNRYSLFQSSWDFQQCHPYLFQLFGFSGPGPSV